MPAAVGIMAYNEGDAIAGAVRAVLDQEGPHVRLGQVVVVASGCTDDTVPRARAAGAGDPRFRILEQAKREGKAAAISALLDSLGPEDPVVLVGGDTLPAASSFESLLAPFEDPAVGMAGGRPVPLNSRRRLMGRVVHLLWELHHRVALRAPKLGELVAFRRIVAEVPAISAVDEAEIEALVRAAGLRLVYAPGAVVQMKGPETVRDFLTQRRRIHAGHLHLRRRQAYAVSTLSPGGFAPTVWQAWRDGAGATGTFAAAILLEAAARGLGWWDARIRGHSHATWKRVSSTKDLAP